MIERARVVVIGGGIGGCSILYWLARLGWSDVALVERSELTSGSTFHSAGLVGQLRNSLSLTQMMMNSVDLYRTLGAEVELETGWREVGRATGRRPRSTWKSSNDRPRWGRDVRTADAPRLGRRSPVDVPAHVDRGRARRGAVAVGRYVDPSQLTLALARGARQRGATILTNTRVTGVRVENHRVRAVETDQGSIECDVVVDAGGIYAHEIGLLAGVHVPLVAMAHQYAITKPTGLSRDMRRCATPRDWSTFAPRAAD